MHPLYKIVRASSIKVLLAEARAATPTDEAAPEQNAPMLPTDGTRRAAPQATTSPLQDAASEANGWMSESSARLTFSLPPCC